MIRATNLLWILLLAGVAAMLFHVSYQVQRQEQQLAETNRDIERQRVAIRVLTAEWAFLNGPDRIETLVHRYLDLQPTLAKQIVAAEAVPVHAPEVLASATAKGSKPAAKTAPQPRRPGPPDITAQSVAFHPPAQSATLPAATVKR